jgi:endonuclease/exonuclease/phosphatase family metal-dependent hydrolase
MAVVAALYAYGCGPLANSDESLSGAHSEDSACPEEPHALAFGSEDTLDVVTWNIQEFPKNGQATIRAVAEVLRVMDVDLFALQEISGVLEFEQMVDHMPGWEAYLDSEWYGGLAYLYRTDTIEVEANYEIYTTEEYWTAFPRSPQVMEFRFMGHDVVVINNHFKCCGDGILEANESWDEETRRRDATILLKDYVDAHLSERRVLIVGDLNDSLTDPVEHNVFTTLLEDSDRYRFADMDIAEGADSDWSFPSYPSHIDHIVLTDELFEATAQEDSAVSSIFVDQKFFDGWWDYQRDVSDHRPVGLKMVLQ